MLQTQDPAHGPSTRTHHPTTTCRACHILPFTTTVSHIHELLGLLLRLVPTTLCTVAFVT